jgi:hypothetical protein
MWSLLLLAFCLLIALPFFALAFELFLRCLPLVPAVLFALWLGHGGCW